MLSNPKLKFRFLTLPPYSDIIYGCPLFHVISFSSARLNIDDPVCPGATACSKCDAFKSGNGFEFLTCEKSCELCPLCSVIYVKPGCDYCKEGTSNCSDNCAIGEIICDKCKKYC